ncbi:7,8-dihydro-6-hydroxymethylpterin- pyrophosphokinase [Plesiocystis pacifica SIR-1]|uniref:2-amino-4-hydroxy-6-hydroxymethyldihydropteridine pyrophosphokinase n=1 Tax=Plesiocystis pacifica SIR-1 TaxID=391625 RepID=A6G5L5_9BACT|nr:2-amino-4-hydroxy-6-hydroxymethyldihydropteridine diphosphokinase [Plesiocystis pacifica]EDM78796.1 7,8-dihydro-6-hydroxymethylpterin- pyrophosphokinase [Plesiocystis pacifica SIR-1]
MSATRYFVGLGSNLGDRLSTLRRALAELAALPSSHTVEASSAWETHPVGPGTGPFLNAIAELHSSLDAPALLAELLTIERRHGRLRRERWGDRTLDLDILLAKQNGVCVRVSSPKLELPHPRMLGRDFVLAPLAELAPTLDLDGRSCTQRLGALPVGERTIIRRLDEQLWAPRSAKLARPGG